MDKKDLACKIWRSSKQLTMQNSLEAADFILENFDPKQQTERVTAKEVYLMYLDSSQYDVHSYEWIAELAHEAAEAFNNYKPEYTEAEQNCRGCMGPCGQCETKKETDESK